MTAQPKEPLETDGWTDVPRMFHAPEGAEAGPLPAPWEAIFGPLRRARQPDGLVVVGQLGQSIDARIATPTGDSHYINGEAGLAHLHRLRALVDAVVVGVGTAVADDPQLTVRRVAGPSPARVVLDPNRRLPANTRLFTDDGVRRLLVARTDAPAAPALPAGVEFVAVRAEAGHMPPVAILAALAQRGLRRILVEGGADTVSRFLQAGCLDRLHVMIAPIIIGSGAPSVTLPPIERVAQALRTPMQVHVLGDEVLLDCDLAAQRMAVRMAKIST